jgi:hypothetical protein
VILATFSPINSKADCPVIVAADDETLRKSVDERSIAKEPAG